MPAPADVLPALAAFNRMEIDLSSSDFILSARTPNSGALKVAW